MQAAVGKSYVATPRHLDYLRELFTLCTDSMSSYQLGTSDVASDIISTKSPEAKLVKGLQEPTPEGAVEDSSASAHFKTEPRIVQQARAVDASELLTEIAKVCSTVPPLAMWERKPEKLSLQVSTRALRLSSMPV